MEKMYVNQFISSLICVIPIVLAGYQQDRVLLTDVKVLTLRHGKNTNYRRSSPVPQLKCIGGTASCNEFVPQVVQCYNKGSDGNDVQWECQTDMDNAYRFGQVEVTCEGYEYPDDPFVLKGSCGLEYALDLTKEGYEKQNRHSQQYSGHHEHQYHEHSNTHSSNRKSKSGFGDLIMLGVVGLIIYGIYKTCIANGQNQTRTDGQSHDQGFSGSQSPPPPGFRPEYMPGKDNCSSGFTSGQSNNTRSNGFGGTGLGGGLGGSGVGGGGFWTGAATGGLLGYLFGGRNNRHGHNTGYGHGYGTGYGNSGYGNSGSSWFGSGSSGFSSGSRSSGFSSSSTGSRTSSGFGGTKRR